MKMMKKLIFGSFGSGNPVFSWRRNESMDDAETTLSGSAFNILAAGRN